MDADWSVLRERFDLGLACSTLFPFGTVPRFYLQSDAALHVLESAGKSGYVVGGAGGAVCVLARSSFGLAGRLKHIFLWI